MDSRPRKLPKSMQVKNKTPAEVQITAEQLLREAKERDLELVPPPPKQKISDPEELESYKLFKRKTYEDAIRRNRSVISNWIKYAQWEEKQLEIIRARSIYERALDVDHRNVTLWLKYTEMEMKNKQVNHARNLWDRVVTLLPRINQFWYKYVYMEEILGNIPRARQVFERWMEWRPDEQAWSTYINFEKRHGEIGKVRDIFERLIMVHPEPYNWIKYAKFEEHNISNEDGGKMGSIQRARNIYERALTFFGDDQLISQTDPKLYIEFARFEERCKEHERVRVIYKYALEHLPKDASTELYKAYTIHEKKFGDRRAIEDVVTNKRRLKYEEEIEKDPLNYDAWFDLLRLLESEESHETELIRDNYEKAISNIPPIQEKRYWRRYIYLWIYYALFEELEMKDVERTRQIYKTCLQDIIPHKVFTFAKIWIMYAHFEIRQKQLTTARKIMGHAIGLCPKDKLFKAYVDLELELRQFDRARKLYAKWLEYNPASATVWVKFAELECVLGDLDRSRYLYNLALRDDLKLVLDVPELVWKAFIDMESEQGDIGAVRALYERLLQRTSHLKVWLSYAEFEKGQLKLAISLSSNSTNNNNNENQDGETISETKSKLLDIEGAYARPREIYRRANTFFAREMTNNPDLMALKQDRYALLQAWKSFEMEFGDKASQAKIEELMPQRVKKRRRIDEDEEDIEALGGISGAAAAVAPAWEEYYDYVFDAQTNQQPNLKLLELAKKWKKQI